MELRLLDRCEVKVTSSVEMGQRSLERAEQVALKLSWWYKAVILGLVRLR